MDWRLIDTDRADPYYVTAADEAISLARKEKKVENTLHFYRRNTPTISIGRSRKIKDDINIDECIKNNIKIVRRITGGGTIYTDENCLIYSLIFDKDYKQNLQANKIFENICNSLTKAMKKFQINTVYKPPNDIHLNGKKISGSALIKKDNIILIHGTILLNTNLDMLNLVLKKKGDYNVSTIYKLLGFLPDIKDIKEKIKNEFEIYFDNTFIKKKFTHYEKKLIDKLLKEKYLNNQWNFKR
jgi:lipoate-protein ligase A